MDLPDLLLLLSIVLLLLWPRFISISRKRKDGLRLPPGPPGWPLVGNLFQVILQRRPFMYIARDLRLLYGPIFTMRMGQRTLIIISDSELTHEALVQKGPLFASRPPDSPTRLLFSVGKCTVNSAEYGPLWRALRRNFVSEIVSPAKVKQFSWIRHWAVNNHLARLRSEYASTGAVRVISNCRLTICSILVCICFGAKVPEKLVQEIEEVMKEVMLMSTLKLADFLPILTPLFRGQLRAAKALRKRQMAFLLPLVQDRRAFVECNGDKSKYNGQYEMVSSIGGAYIDSLFELNPAGRGQLGEEEMVTLCSEVLSAGTDTSTTALEWALLELVLNPHVQEKLFKEVAAKVKKGEIINEMDAESLEYLTAVVKETLRRHPPSHFVLSHAATADTELGGYLIPAGVNVEFYTPWVTEDPAVWDKPEEFRPERFLKGGEGAEVDVTGKKAVRMMPFGVGRRICPAAGLGTLHVQLMLATMVREFQWTAVPGETPDPTETFAFTVVMKNSLRAAIHERD